MGDSRYQSIPPALRSAATTLRRVTERADDIPTHRYTAALANEIERTWQDRWDAEHVFWTPNRTGLLAEDPRHIADRPSLFVLDMFPYPSGVGPARRPPARLHRDRRVRALQPHERVTTCCTRWATTRSGCRPSSIAVQTGTHPRVTTEENIANMKRQMRALGLGHDPRRGPATTDVDYYRWTQWIFLQIYNSWYDTDADRARPIGELVEELRARNARRRPTAARSTRCSAAEQRALVDSYRLAYIAEAPVNWCPGSRHGARQRRGHRRRPQRARQLPGVQASAEAVDAAHHRVRRPVARRSRRSSTGPTRSS